jgi:hypothetical protein
MRRIAVFLLLALLGAGARADGTNAPIKLELSIGPTLSATHDPIYDQGAAGLRVTTVVHNGSGRAWRGLRLTPAGLDNPDGNAAVTPSARLYHLETTALTTWRARSELRINDVYQGLPGGEWDIALDAQSGKLELSFIEPLAPGATLRFAFDAADLGGVIFRLDHEAIPAPRYEPRRLVAYTLIAAGVLGLAALAFTRRRRR